MAGLDKFATHHEPAVRKIDYRTIFKWETVLTLEEMKELFVGGKPFAFDTETTGLNPETCRIAGFSFAFDYQTGYYVPLRHKIGQNAPRECLDFVYEQICSTQIVFMYNKKFDLNVLQLSGGFGVKPLLNVFDVMGWVWLRDTDATMPSLKKTSEHFLGIVQPTFGDTAGDQTFDYALIEEATEYAAIDAIATFGLAVNTSKKVPDVQGIFNIDNLSIEAIRVFEIEKVKLDVEFLKEEERMTYALLQDLEKDIHSTIGYSFNINSGPQRSDALLKAGVLLTEKTEKGAWKTNQEVLDSLEHPVAQKMAKYGKEKTYYGSFIKKLIADAGEEGRLRFNYKMMGTVTGRLSSGDKKDKKKPNDFYAGINAQNIPKAKQVEVVVVRDAEAVTGWKILCDEPVFEGENKWDKIEEYRKDLAQEYGEIWMCETGGSSHGVRSAFVAEEESIFVSADYSGVELRIAANMSGEAVWINTFLEGGDLHLRTAQGIYGEHADSNHRKKSKGANFNLLYGGGVHALIRMGMPESEAEDFMGKYLAALPTLARWKEYRKKRARKDGVLFTAFGRPFRMRKYYSKQASWKQQSYGDRCALNYGIQGSSADILRIVLGKLLNYRMKYPQVCDQFRFISTVHDEINFSVKKSFMPYFMRDIPAMMEMHLDGWKVPLEVEVGIGDNWSRIIPYDYDQETQSYTPIGKCYKKED